MDIDNKPGRLLTHSDTWVGFSILVTGGAAAMMASGFDALSRTYPLVLSILLMAFGAGLILRAALSSVASVSFALPGAVAGFAALLLVLWILALAVGLGFLLPTFVMQLAFLLLCGVRPLGLAALYAALVTAAGYAVFALGLGVRLPASLHPFLL